MKKTRVVIAIVCVLCVILSLLLPMFLLKKDSGVGIIGGAGTPTYGLIYFRSGSVWLTVVGVLGLLALAGVAIRRRFGKQ